MRTSNVASGNAIYGTNAYESGPTFRSANRVSIVFAVFVIIVLHSKL